MDEKAILKVEHLKTHFNVNSGILANGGADPV